MAWILLTLITVIDSAKRPSGVTLHWALMVVAMMWPLYRNTATAIANASFRRWRAVAVMSYLGVISVLWLGFGVAAMGVFRLVPAGVPEWLWPVAWLLTAAVLARSHWRIRVLRRCLRLGVLAPRASRAARTATRTAARQWQVCVVLCGPVMMAMVAVHHVVPMLTASIAIWWEQRHAYAWRDPVPLALLIATAAIVLAYTWMNGGAASGQLPTGTHVH